MSEPFLLQLPPHTARHAGRDAGRAPGCTDGPARVETPVGSLWGDGYSRWTDHSVHLCFRTPRARFPRTRLLSHMPVIIGALPVTYTTGWTCDLRFDAFPSRGIAPSRHSVGLAVLQRYSLQSPTHNRPHVSLSEALPSAFASCGIPRNTPCGWHLLRLTHESTCCVTPFPISMLRIRRTVLSTGFLWQCRPVSGFDCRRLILCPFGSSVSASYAG